MTFQTGTQGHMMSHSSVAGMICSVLKWRRFKSLAFCSYFIILCVRLAVTTILKIQIYSVRPLTFVILNNVRNS